MRCCLLISLNNIKKRATRSPLLNGAPAPAASDPGDFLGAATDALSPLGACLNIEGQDESLLRGRSAPKLKVNSENQPGVAKSSSTWMTDSEATFEV
jgi:hypothetical protein